MECEILESNDKKIRFILRGITAPLANALRRIMTAEVPILALDEIIIIENSSIMDDEILAHRLGFIPIKTDLDAYDLPDDLNDAQKSSALFTLEAEAGDSVRTVYSSELMSQDPKTEPANGNIPIVKLAPKQRIHLEAYARLGQGKEHVKWQPTSACTYKYLPIIKIDSKKCNACGKCVNICPKGILSIKDNKLKIESQMRCTICKDCEEECPFDPPAIKIGQENGVFIFYVESTGALKVERIVLEAAKILDMKAHSFISQLSSIKTGGKAENEVKSE
jgi:DNA-directed RNA polymerase subunit D